MNEPSASSPRSPLAVLGIVLIVIGFVLFLSTFFSAAANFGNFDNFEERGRSMGLRAVGGMTLIIVGGAISAIGGARRGAPQTFGGAKNAVRDMVAAVAHGVKDANKVPPIACPYCNTANDPSLAKCQSCGAALATDKRCPGCGKQNNPDA